MANSSRALSPFRNDERSTSDVLFEKIAAIKLSNGRITLSSYVEGFFCIVLYMKFTAAFAFQMRSVHLKD